MKITENIVGIVDYNVGNVNSVRNAVERIGYRAIITSDEDILLHCSHLVLPGVGAFEEAIYQLKKSGLIDFLEDAVFTKKIPILGICVGMQLMLKSSTENGFNAGLGWIDGEVDLLKVPENYTLPHVGWNNLLFDKNSLFYNIDKNANFYFDHNYECKIYDNSLIGSTKYPETIHAAINKENIYAVQFHPEKSQIDGLRIFKNFIEKC
ncbi:imidazole glycerol phosphate synthase subunit HisH [Flavobacteriaceae bacterium]|nr:imidazole glycerol phosphate synthase subunit HisH [Flavobacteriaceae bacterium]